MKINYIKSFAILCLAGILTSCSSDFEDFNTDPYGVSDGQLEQDYNNYGVYFPDMIRVLVNPEPSIYQIGQNLTSDSWAGYLAPPTPFSGGRNNTTYSIVWDDGVWNGIYDELMAPANKVINLAQENDKPQFEYWAKLIQIYGMQKVAAFHGPVIYSQYGQNSTTSYYDSEEELYKRFFKELDTINNVLMDYKDFDGFKDFDIAYNGNVSQWIQLSNSLRLMLALRLSDVKPQLAQEQAEKAAAQSEGLLASNADNFNVDLGADRNPIYTIGYDYNDTRMSATMESFLVGFQDPRISKYFTPVSDANMDLVQEHPDFPYKGVKNGAKLNDKEARTPFSKPGEHFISAQDYTVLNYADVNFMLAEAQLRGWNVGTMSTKDYYEEGVRASFEQWTAPGAEDYLEDDQHSPINYTDPAANTPEVNAFEAQTDITVKWKESASKEKKLERIMTQKWIAGFPNSVQAWVDFRRTGYPAIEPVYKNDSGSGDGIIPEGDFIKRMRFIQDEYNENPKGVEDATTKLDGPDKISTSLWWDIEGANF